MSRLAWMILFLWAVPIGAAYMWSMWDAWRTTRNARAQSRASSQQRQ